MSYRESFVPPGGELNEDEIKLTINDVEDLGKMDSSSFEKEVNFSRRGLERLRARLEQIELPRNKEELLPRVSLFADGDKIKDQQVNAVINQDGSVTVRLKLTDEHFKKVISDIEQNNEVGDGHIEYLSNDSGDTLKLADAVIVNVGSINVKFSKGSISGLTQRVSLGLVEIIIPEDILNKNYSQTDGSEDELDNIFRHLLKIDTGMTPPEEKDRKALFQEVYAIHHKINISSGDTGELNTAFEDILGIGIGHNEDDIKAVSISELSSRDQKRVEKIVREEVAPGYLAPVEVGRNQEYAKQYSDFASFHVVEDFTVLPKIFKAGGIFSSNERYSRGLFLGGFSSTKDLASGGGDGVFTRTITEGGVEKQSGLKNLYHFLFKKSNIMMVFDPSLFDRLDWYAYNYDRYGDTDPSVFKDRQSPNDLFVSQKEWSNSSGAAEIESVENEQIFKIGIGTQYFKALVCEGDSERQEVIRFLKSEGIYEFNGQDIEDFVIVAQDNADLIDIANGRQPRSTIKTAA